MDKKAKFVIIGCGRVSPNHLDAIMHAPHAELLAVCDIDEEKAKRYFTKFSFSVQDWISEVGISEATIKVLKADKEESK